MQVNMQVPIEQSITGLESGGSPLPQEAGIVDRENEGCTSKDEALHPGATFVGVPVASPDVDTEAGVAKASTMSGGVVHGVPVLKQPLQMGGSRRVHQPPPRFLGQSAIVTLVAKGKLLAAVQVDARLVNTVAIQCNLARKHDDSILLSHCTHGLACTRASTNLLNALFQGFCCFQHNLLHAGRKHKLLMLSLLYVAQVAPCTP